MELFSKSRREVVGSSSVGEILGRTSVGGNLDLFRIYGNSGILYTRIDIFLETFFKIRRGAGEFRILSGGRR